MKIDTGKRNRINGNFVPKSSVSVVLTLLLLLIFSFPLKIQAQEDFQKLLEKVEQLRKRAQLDSAISLGLDLEQRFEIPSINAEIKIALAKCFLDQNNWGKSFTYLAAAEQQLKLPENDLILAELLNVKGEWAFQQDRLLEAREHYESSLGIRETYLGPESEKVADSYNNLGNVYYLTQDYENAILAHQQALTIREKIFTPPHADLGSSYNNLAACYFDLGMFSQALGYNENALEQRRAIYGEAHPLVASSYNNLGNCFFELNELEKAVDNFNAALVIQESTSNQSGMASTLNNLGNAYQFAGDYQQAIQYFESALSLYRDVFTEDNLATAEVYSNLGNALLSTGDQQTAFEALNRAKYILQNQLGTDVPNLIPILINEGLALRSLQDYTQAERSFTDAIRLLINSFGNDHPLLATCYNNLGSNQFDQGLFDEARANFVKALAIFQIDPLTNLKEIASCQMNIGNCVFEKGLINEAISWYGKAVQGLGEDLQLLELRVSIANNWAKAFLVQGQIQEAIQLLEKQLALFEAAKITSSLSKIDLLASLIEAYATLGDQQNLEKALQVCEQATNYIDGLLSAYQNQQSKQRLHQSYYYLYEKGIATAFQLYQKEKKPTYLERGFLISEQSKGLLIKEALNKDQAMKFAGLPDSLLQKENQLTQALAEYEQIRYEQAHLLDSVSLRQVDYEILQLKEEYRNLLQDLERDYPDYYELKHQGQTQDINALQVALQAQEKCAVSYFVGDTLMYAFVLFEGQIELFEIAKGELEREVIQLWDGISNFTSAQLAEDYQNYAAIYARNAQVLHQKIFAPIAKEKGLPESVLIIPDGVLCLLPFDLLLASSPDSARLFRFQNYDYLIQHHQFSYAYSANLWMLTQSNHRERAKWRFTAFAPEFSGNSSDLPPLYYNIPESENLSKIIRDHKTFKGKAASIREFRKYAPQSKIVHLATHGKANALQTDFAYLAFAPQDSLSPFLYSKNIYALALNKVDMVVLSACETGLGEVQPGEGIISLAHAFTYAGARSIITTLWSIDDQKTSEIMSDFYRNLKQGMTKDEALRQAKLQYLDQYAGENAHPFFWSAFVPLGNMEALELGSNGIWYWVLGAGILLILGFLNFKSLGNLVKSKAS